MRDFRRSGWENGAGALTTADRLPEIDGKPGAPEPGEIHPECAAEIARFNAGSGRSFRDYAALRTHGLDAFSSMGAAELADRIGVGTFEAIAEAFPDAKQAASCARWIARGLEPRDAVRKAAVEAEIAARGMR